MLTPFLLLLGCLVAVWSKRRPLNIEETCVVSVENKGAQVFSSQQSLHIVVGCRLWVGVVGFKVLLLLFALYVIFIFIFFWWGRRLSLLVDVQHQLHILWVLVHERNKLICVGHVDNERVERLRSGKTYYTHTWLSLHCSGLVVGVP